MWINALNSGEYRKGRGCLVSEQPCGGDKFCCLGVLSNVFIERSKAGRDFSFEKVDSPYSSRLYFDGTDAYSLPDIVGEWAGITEDEIEHINTLIDMNDSVSHHKDGAIRDKYTFKRIAKYIEKNL